MQMIYARYGKERTEHRVYQILGSEESTIKLSQFLQSVSTNTPTPRKCKRIIVS